MSLAINEIRLEILDVIDKLDQIIASEKYNSTYVGLKENYQNVLILINDNATKEVVLKELAYTIRMLMEAPPSSKTLGMEALLLMDKAYKHLESLN